MSWHTPPATDDLSTRPAPPAGWPDLNRRVAPWAGPTLIIASVLVVMHGFWLHPKLTFQHVDLLAQWLPWYCHTAKSLLHGTIPTWQPFQFGGAPFISDPQKGWLYLPVILLYGPLGCARALGLFITLQPLLAGLGLYWFFRREGLTRTASTVGGLTLSMVMSNSRIAIALPFSGTLAWTAVALAAASGYVHARGARSRAGWLALMGLATSQVAAAQLTDGLVVMGIVLVLYLLARLGGQARAGSITWGRAALLLALPLVAAPALSAAVLIPPLSLLPRTPIGHGYQAMARIGGDLSGVREPPAFAGGVGPWWGTSFARGPAGYAGALALLLIPSALASRKWRVPAAAFALAGLVGWLLNLNALVRSDAVRRFVLKTSLGELWLHAPIRFRYLVALAIAALAGYGFQAWLDWGRSEGRRALAFRLMPMAAVALVFVLGPILAGASALRYVYFAVGFVYSVSLLTRIARGDRWAVVLLPVLLAVELVTAGLVQQGGPRSGVRAELAEGGGSGLGTSFPSFHAPFIDATDYLKTGPIGRTLISARGDYGRYLSFDDRISVYRDRGFVNLQTPRYWGAYENARSMLFGLYEVQGYSPVQLDRYWRLVRKVSTRPLYYNAAVFQSIDPSVLKLLGVEWLILSERSALPDVVDPTPVASEGTWRLYRVASPDPRASVVFSARPVSESGALDAVLGPGFEPSREAVVEAAAPALRGLTGQGAGSARYTELSSQHIRVTVTATHQGLLVVRNVFDDNWHASIDGRSAPLLRTDYLLQGVIVPPGAHRVDLTYRDAAVGVGLVVGGSAWLVLLVVMGLLWYLGRRSSPVDR